MGRVNSRWRARVQKWREGKEEGKGREARKGNAVQLSREPPLLLILGAECACGFFCVLLERLSSLRCSYTD